MFDEKNERKEFVADDQAEAVAKACEFFGVEESALEIGTFPDKSVYGLASRTVVVAALKDRTPPAPGGGGGDRDRGDRGGRGGRGRDRDARGGRERGGRGGRGRGRDRDRGGRGERAEEAAPPPAEPTEPSVGKANGELGEIGQFVLGVLERMDRGPFEISENSEDGLLAFEVTGPAALAVSGSDGRAVDALSLIANQVASRIDEDPPRVVLDVEGDSDAREDRLETLAKRVAGRAIDTGRTVKLDPMNGRDRRMIHIALRDHDGVATMSAGEGRYRQVLVVPEGAPEYEEAQRESSSASQRDD